MKHPDCVEEKKIKCVVWDLDNTVWDGIIAEGDEVVLRESAVEVIKTLDKRGILQSIASKNDYNMAMAKLDKFSLKNYFLYPQINWDSKSSCIEQIVKSLNIGIDTFAFIDDQDFEREEVKYHHPEVLCIDAREIDKLLERPEMNPRFITDDTKIRRKMYQNDIKRNNDEEKYHGSKDEFLSTLDMTFSIEIASEDDLRRAEELTVRTHQLNTTGYTYSYDELNEFRKSDKHLLLIASLVDKFGTYGKIGLCLIEVEKEMWTIKLLLMSCRVMSRGVGSVLINYIRNEARKNDVKLKAEFIHTDVNRMMYMTYKFAHFNECHTKNGFIIFENDLSQIASYPEFIKLNLKPLCLKVEKNCINDVSVRNCSQGAT